MDRQRFLRLSREGAWVVSGQILIVAGALVAVRVLTEYLTPAEYGHLALGLTVGMLVNQVIMGSATAGVARFHAVASGQDDLSGCLRASCRLLGWSTALVILLGAVLVPGLYRSGHGQWIGLALFAADRGPAR